MQSSPPRQSAWHDPRWGRDHGSEFLLLRVKTCKVGSSVSPGGHLGRCGAPGGGVGAGGEVWGKACGPEGQLGQIRHLCFLGPLGLSKACYPPLWEGGLEGRQDKERTWAGFCREGRNLGNHLDVPALLLIKAGAQLYCWWSDRKQGSWVSQAQQRGEGRHGLYPLGAYTHTRSSPPIPPGATMFHRGAKLPRWESLRLGAGLGLLLPGVPVLVVPEPEEELKCMTFSSKGKRLSSLWD